MENLPGYVAVTFGIVLILAIGIFARATHYSKPFLALLLILIVVQSALGLSGFYSDVNTMTTRFPLLVAPMFIICASLFFHPKGRIFIESIDIKVLVLLHTVRIVVEFVLFWLYTHKGIPQAMTFEGRNFDILSGLSAPLIYYFGFIRKQLSKPVLITWNVICVLLLLSVVSSAILSLPARFEKFGFEQPNTAVAYFPFLLLPAILVPLVLFAHAATVRQLIGHKS